MKDVTQRMTKPPAIAPIGLQGIWGFSIFSSAAERSFGLGGLPFLATEPVALALAPARGKRAEATDEPAGRGTRGWVGPHGRSRDLDELARRLARRVRQDLFHARPEPEDVHRGRSRRTGSLLGRHVRDR